SRTEGCVTVLMQSKRTGTRVGPGPTVPAVARVRAPRILLDVQRLVTTAGHVDHGKSTLVRALTGHDPDRWEEERARGLTIDLGFEWTTRTRLREGFIGPAAVEHPRRWDHLEDLVFFVDVPGHHRFIDNLLTAMVDARFVLLVVSGVEGWSQGTQVHVDILD